nr:apolipophorins-like isoform X1 [Biomphalaria glabrata]
MSEVAVQRSDPDSTTMVLAEDQTFKLALERNSLRFAFQDGRIDTLCPSVGDEVMSLNFKRGVLSVFQNSMNQLQNGENLQEIDITGTCPTAYTITQKGWKSTEVTRTKDLLGCSDRHNYRSALKSTPIHVPDTIKSLPLLKGSYKCSQMINSEGLLSTAICTESLVFRPFSKKESGARTETVQKLTFVSKLSSVNTRKDLISSKTDLLFVHEEAEISSEKTLWSAKDKLTQLCRITAQDLPVEVPDLFTDLVYALRSLKSSLMTDLYEQLKRGSICSDNKERIKKFFLDALPMVETSASIEVMGQMLVSEDVSGSQADYWLNSLHFVRKPTSDMISQLLTIVKTDKLQLKSLLPVSSMIKTFCQSNEDCVSNRDIGDILNVWENILDDKCQSTDEKLVLMTLRAAGNMGYSDKLARKLKECITSQETAMNARVFAAQAYTGISCSADRQVLMKTFEDVKEDSELRIAAYLSAMHCWNEELLKKVKLVLESETSNQVSSFVWTHLTNLMETSSPYKQALKDILNDEVIKKKSGTNSKHSGNYEVSFFSERFGAGATAESNLIWSTKSFLPRSAMVNLTVDIFGQSVQLLELGGRVQGIEALLQKFIGSKLFKGGESVTTDSGASGCVENDKIENMKKKYPSEQDMLTASLYLRMFGHELDFKHYNEKELLALRDQVPGKVTSKGVNQDISYSQSFMFLESQMTVPTIAGLPLTLSINGTASLDLQAKLESDVKKHTMKATFDIKPSGAILVSGLMSINAGPTSTGLKMTSTLHTSTSVTGRIEAGDKQVLSLEFDTPDKVMDILEIKTDFFILHNKNEKKQSMLTDKKMTMTSCTPDSVFKVTGYELCAAVAYVDSTKNPSTPYMPLSGPLLLSLTLQKKDAPKGYKMTIKYIQNVDTSTASVAIDTSGSKVDRKINIGYYLDTKERKLDAEFVSPWKTIMFEATYPQERSNMHAFSASANVDGDLYKIFWQADKKLMKGKEIWSPKLEIMRPKQSRLSSYSPESVSARGTVEINEDLEEISTDLTANIVSNDQTALGKTLKALFRDGYVALKAKYINKEKQKTFSGSFSLNKKDSYSATLQLLLSDKKSGTNKYEPTILISTPENEKLFLLSGKMDYKPEKSFDGNLQINMDQTLKEPITLNASAILTKKSKNKYQGKGSFKSSFMTLSIDGSADIPVTFRGKKSAIVNKWTVEYNIPSVKDKELRKNKLTINSKIHDESAKGLTKYNAQLNMDSKNYPPANFDANLVLSYKNSSTSSKLVLRHGPETKEKKTKGSSVLTLLVDLGHDISDVASNISYNLQVLYPVKNIEYQVKGKHEHQLKKFKLETYAAIVYQKGKTVELRLMGNDNSKKNLDATGSLEINYPKMVVDSKDTEGGKYRVVTSISQNANKDYIHTVSLQLNEVKHSLVNTFKKNRDDFSLFSEMDVNGDEPRKITVKAAKNVDQVEGLFTYNAMENVYSVGFNLGGMSKQSQSHVFSWQVTIPERKVQSSVEIGNSKQLKLKADLLWDALKDPQQKVATDIIKSIDKENNRDEISITITTPFVNHTIYKYNHVNVYNSREIRNELKFVWGRPVDELSYAVSAKVPLSFERFEIRGDLVTPLESLRKIGMGVSHKFDGSRYLSSSVNGTYNNDYLVVGIQVRNSGDKMSNDLSVSTIFNSSIEIMRNVMLSLTHKMEDKVYETDFLYKRNNVQYSANMRTVYTKAIFNHDIESTLTVTLPQESASLQVVYSNYPTLTKFNATAKMTNSAGVLTQVNLNTQFNKQAQEYGVNVKIVGRWPTFSGLELNFRHNMLNGITGSASLLVRTNPNVRSTLTYSATSLQLQSYYNPYNTDLNIKYESYPFTLVLEHKNPKAEDGKISLEASLDLKDKKEALAEVNLITPYEHLRNMDLKFKVQNTLESIWKLESIVSMDTRKKIQVEGDFDLKDFRKCNGKITTPFKELSKLQFGHSTQSVEQSWFYTEGFLEAQPYFSRVKLEHNVTLQAPYNSKLYFDLPGLEMKYLKLDLMGNKLRNGYTFDMVARYHLNQELNLKMKSKVNMNKFPQDTSISLDVTTPFAVLPKLDTTFTIDKDKDKWVSNLGLSSGDVKMNVKEILSKTSSYSDFEISASDIEPVTAGVHLDWSELVGVNISLDAASIGKTVMGFKKRSESWTNFQNRVFGEYNGKELDLDIGLTHDAQQSKAWLTYIYPGSDTSYLKTSVHKVGNSAQDFDIGGFLQLGKSSKPFNISTQYSFTDQKLAFGTTLETPYTDSMSYYLKRETQTKGENNIVVYGKYSNNFLIDFSVGNKLTGNSLDYSVRGEYLFNKKSNKLGTSINANWGPDNRYEANMDSYFDKKWVKMDFDAVGNAMKRLSVENLDVKFKSNIPNFKDVGAVAFINKEAESYSGKVILEYMDENEAHLSVELSNPSLNNVNLKMDLELPKVAGFERNTLNYNHATIGKKQLISNVQVNMGSGESLNGKMDYSNDKVTLTLTGPVQEFESLTIAGQFSERKQQISGTANVKLTRDVKPAELIFNINLNNYKPLVMNFTLKSPFENLKSTTLTIQHDFQNWSQMKTTSKLQLDNFGDINSQMSLTFDSPLNVELTATLTSAIKDMESLNLLVKSEDRDRSHSSKIQFGWKPDHELKLFNKWAVTGSNQNLRLSSSFELSSPFDEIKLAKINLDHSYGPNLISESIQFMHNDKSYLEADLYYQKSQYHNASVVFKNPRPMSLELIGSTSTGNLDGNFKLNWDKQTPNSHVEVTSSYKDQSDSQNTDVAFKVKVLHPVRSMGVGSTYKRSDKELFSSSHVTWDEENSNTVGYDINWVNMTTRYSQKYEGHTKVTIPQRSIKLQGSYSDAGTTQSTTTVFLWDANKDDKKRLTVLTEVENKDNFKRVNLNINLPNTNKQLILSGITKGGYGTTLIDSKAEISYSSDPDKMIIIRSLLSDLAIGSKGNYNYTAQFEFKHAKTNSDVKLVSHVAHVDKVCSAGGQLSFLTASKERKLVELWSNLDTDKQTMTLRVSCPLKTISMQGQVVEFASHKDFTLTTFENDKETTALDIKLDQKRKEIVAEFNYDRDDPTKILKLTSRYVNDSAVQVTIVSQNGKQTSEGIIAVRLNTSEILHTRVAWRPMLFNDMKMFIGSKITAFSYIANEVFNSSVTHIGLDLKSRYLLISQELMTELDQVFRLMNDELNIFYQQLNGYSREFRRFILRNDLHIQELGDNIRTTFDALNTILQNLAKSSGSYYNTVSQATNEFLYQLRTYPVAERYSMTIKELVQGLMTARQVLEKALNDATEDLDKFSHVTYKAYLDVSRSLDQKLQSYSRAVYELPIYQKMMKQMERLGQKGSEVFPEFASYYNAFYLKTHQILQEQFHDVMSRSEFQHSYALLHEVHQQILYWNKEQKIDKIAERLVETSKNLLMLELVKLRSSLLNSKVIVYDPERGELQFELHLPFTLKSLKETPKLSANSMMNTVKSLSNVNIPENLPVVLNNYYNSLPTISPSYWIPTFKASAYLVGGRQVTTFDGASYQILSPCRYVLAHDMLQDNFTLVLNYERRVKQSQVRSLCLTIENSLTFDISDDYKIKVQGRDTEMPYITDKVKITRNGDVISAEYVGGLELVSNPKLDLYKVTVDRWYHNRVKGMLGQFDNEVANDVAMEQDNTGFEVDRKSCSVKNTATTTPVNDEDSCYKVFYSMFSRFSTCFNKVDPVPFVKLCQLYKQTKSEDDAIYLATEQYRFLCQDQGANIDALSDYVPCSDESPLLIEGTDALYQSADVLFLVEDNSCNKWANPSLAAIVTELNKVLNIAGKKTNSFGMISYGGVLNEPVVRTINGQHFGEASYFLRALETLRFSTNETQGDLIDAINLAMEYPFRTGVAKILVAVPCSTCDFTFLQGKMLTSNLISKGFSVHVLRKQPDEQNTMRRPKISVYGLDNSKFFTSAGEEPLTIPFSNYLASCDALALQTSGAVFNNGFMLASPRGQQNFIKALTQRIGLNAKLPDCQTCECSSETGRFQCQLCYPDLGLGLFSSSST